MKSSFSISVCYILYLAVALCVCPVKNVELPVSKTNIVVQPKEEKPLAAQNHNILHEELLFETAGF